MSNSNGPDTLELATLLTPTCMVCGDAGRIMVPLDGVLAWYRGALVQDAFPNLIPSEREQVQSGIHPSCWDELMREWEDV